MKTKTHRIIAQLLAEIENLRKQGYSYRKIAKILSKNHREHYSYSLIYQTCKRVGI